MLLDMLYRHLVTLFMIALFSIMLFTRKSSRDTEQRYFWLTILSCLFLVLEDSFEVIASLDPSRRFWRTLLSMLGYTFRSTAALGLLLVVVPRGKRTFVLWIPALVTLLVNSTAFFTDAAFGFNEKYEFYRGPLGFVAFVVPIMYLLMILWITYTRFTESKGLQKLIAPGCAVFCLSASMVDVLHGGIRLDEAIMISSIFFFIVLHAHDNRRDPLTGLLNRKALYNDCSMYNKTISAVASMDMNGLKRMNDTLGHHAGDEALVKIAEYMKHISDREAASYRIGGDEFIILFFGMDEDAVRRSTEKIAENVAENGYSLSAGYAMREGNEDIEETIRRSDARMYANKAEYYRVQNHDRRRRRDDTGNGNESAAGIS